MDKTTTQKDNSNTNSRGSKGMPFLMDEEFQLCIFKEVFNPTRTLSTLNKPPSITY